MKDSVYDIRDYGAQGDGTTDATTALQTAIDACSMAGGGRVLVDGGSYFLRPIVLRSGVDLHIAAGGALRASVNPEDYPLCASDRWRPDRAPRDNTRHLVYAENARNIAITGRGRIECNGQEFLIKEDDTLTPPRWKRKSDLMIPARTILLVGCEDVRLEDISIIDSAGWTTWILDCDRVHVDRVKILALRKIPNADGLHLDASRDVTVSDCVIKCGDDSIAICCRQAPLTAPKPCERIVITNCVLQSDRCAIRVGWSSQYEIRDVTVSNIVINDTTCGVGMRISPYSPGMVDGMVDAIPLLIERISFNNIIMNGILKDPIHISVEKGAQVRMIRDIMFSNIQANSNWPPFISGHPECELTDISLSNINLKITGADCPTPLLHPQDPGRPVSTQECHDHYGMSCPRSYLCPARPQYFRHVRNLVLNNVHVTYARPDNNHSTQQ